MILKQIGIQGFRSILDASVKFQKGLNILIGKNGAGKSNLLQFIRSNTTYISIRNNRLRNRLTSDSYQFSVEYLEGRRKCELIANVTLTRRLIKNEVEFAKSIKLSKKESGKYIYENQLINLHRNSDSGTNKYYKELAEVLRSSARRYISFKLPDTLPWLEKTVKYEVNSDFETYSESEYEGISITTSFDILLEVGLLSRKKLEFNTEDFSEWKSFFLRKFEELKENYRISTFLNAHTPIDDIRLNQNINFYKAEEKVIVDNLLIEFKLQNNWVPWSYLSDGTKRLFYIITECLSINNGLLLIEEPELGIHPHQLYSLMEFLRERSTSNQIIISTHSPIVLDILDPSELNRITIVNVTEKGTQFSKLNKEQTIAAKAYMEKFGELSYYWLHSDLEND